MSLRGLLRRKAARTEADICLILEGSYPYVRGGVSSWTHELIRALPDRQFALLSILPRNEKVPLAYELPDNVVSLTTLHLDAQMAGRAAKRTDAELLQCIYRHAQSVLFSGGIDDFKALRSAIEQSGLGHDALLNSRWAWKAITASYDDAMPETSLLQYFWTMRSLMSGLLVSLFGELPDARVYHAISTGYAGLVGARATIERQRPLLITEHGIYTNERRIELQVADWLYDSQRKPFSVAGEHREMRDLWMSAFSGFARLAYDSACRITTLFEGNQMFQIADGADPRRLEVIPNGVDVERFAAYQADRSALRPTVALIARLVPIKDVQMFIAAVDVLRREVPEVRALVLGGDDEDPAYAAECYAQVKQRELGDVIEFRGHVNVTDYLPEIHLLVLTSLSEAQPLSILEAGAAGIPSVSTDVGSCRELLEGCRLDPVEGAGGRVVPCSDAVAAGRAMAEILKDPQLLESMGDTMLERVETTYNKQTINARYQALYDYAAAQIDGNATTQQIDPDDPVALSVGAGG